MEIHWDLNSRLQAHGGQLRPGQINTPENLASMAKHLGTFIPVVDVESIIQGFQQRYANDPQAAHKREVMRQVLMRTPEVVIQGATSEAAARQGFARLRGPVCLLVFFAFFLFFSLPTSFYIKTLCAFDELFKPFVSEITF